jgi:histidinol-phosphate phosphatase family protein
VINEDTNLISRLQDFHIYPFAIDAIKKLNDANFITAVITNQSAIARGLLTETDLHHIHDHLQSKLAEIGGHIDAIYYCPHHPEGNFPNAQSNYIKTCSCRKPNDGMLQAASKDFPIDFKASWLVGDSERDILAGKKAGVTTIAVRTGHGNKNYDAAADFFCSHLEEAVSIICETLPAQLWSTLKSRIGEQPLVIHVNGKPFSGKSTLINQLQHQAKRDAITTQHIVVPNDETAEAFLSQLASEEFVSYQVQSNNAHWQGNRVTTRLDSAAITFIEYPNAVDCHFFQANNNQLWRISIPERIRQQRFREYMKWNAGQETFFSIEKEAANDKKTQIFEAVYTIAPVEQSYTILKKDHTP